MIWLISVTAWIVICALATICWACIGRNLRIAEREEELGRRDA